jgi:hypothetical protein
MGFPFFFSSHKAKSAYLEGPISQLVRQFRFGKFIVEMAVRRTDVGVLANSGKTGKAADLQFVHSSFQYEAKIANCKQFLKVVSKAVIMR